MMERYGNFFSGSDFDLDQTLVEQSTEPSAADGSSQVSARSRGRKSAGPAVLSQATLASGSARDASAAGKITSLSRRRRTIAPGIPGQVCELYGVHASRAINWWQRLHNVRRVHADLSAAQAYCRSADTGRHAI